MDESKLLYQKLVADTDGIHVSGSAFTSFRHIQKLPEHLHKAFFLYFATGNVTRHAG
jgi:hypothetical protein